MRFPIGSTFHNVTIQLILGAIRTYQLALSPFLGQTCRFYPSCSEYAHQALARYGLIKGCHLAARRLLKCHPFHHGGVDPLP